MQQPVYQSAKNDSLTVNIIFRNIEHEKFSFDRSQNDITGLIRYLSVVYSEECRLNCICVLAQPSVVWRINPS
jgi:hypothetical protein